MLVVTMTSWPKRINNVVKVLDSILRNTLSPDRVYLNLCTEEFPNRNADLPLVLTMFINVNPKVIINWVDGPNTKTFKKIVPILRYLNDDDIIISADDDFTFPNDLIVSRLTDFKIYKGKHPITPNTSNLSSTSGARIKYYMSPSSLFTKRMLAGWEKWYTPELIDMHQDDRVNTYVIYSNGYGFMPATKYTLSTLTSKFNISNNDMYALSKMTKYNATSISIEKALARKLSGVPELPISIESDISNRSLAPTRDIYILWATRRPLIFKSKIKQWLASAKLKHRIFIRVAVDSKEDAKELVDFDTIITNNVVPGVCYPCYCLSSTFTANENDIVIFASDDFTPPNDWDVFLENNFTENKVLVVNDGIQKYPNKVVTIPIMTYGALKMMNFIIYHPVYAHMHSDVELYTTAEKLGLIKDIRNVSAIKFTHEHHSTGIRKIDDVDKALDSSYSTGKKLLDSRQKCTIDELLCVDKAIVDKVQALKIDPIIKKIKLSILICSLHSRANMLNKLLDVIYKQTTTNNVEVLIDVDDGNLSIGAKRNQLLTKAIGDYICYIDDDDLISDDYINKILEAIKTKPDCCSLTGIMTTNGLNPEKFIHSYKYTSWSNEIIAGQRVYYRTPNHLNAVKRSLAVATGFNDKLNKGEDRDYSNRLYPLLKTESTIAEPIYYYLYKTTK